LNYSERYSRHILLKDFGEEGQLKLSKAKVLVIGAGGLGCPILQYLVASGIGNIGIADHDVASLSNLQRQILFSVSDIGKSKAIQAKEKLLAMNPDIKIEIFNKKITNLNSLKIIENYDIIVDATDNFKARYTINDACVLLEKPLVFGAIFQYEGQVAVFNVEDEKGKKTNYRHLFPNPPTNSDAPNCNEIGVLGVLPGIIGILQATEVIKLISGIGKPLCNQLLIYNLLSSESYKVTIPSHDLPKNLIPENIFDFEQRDYGQMVGEFPEMININVDRFKQLLLDEEAIFIDVREFGELPEADFEHLKIPLPTLSNHFLEMTKPKIILFCQSGIRSKKAYEIVKNHFSDTKELYNLEGGILNLKNIL